MLNTEQLSYTSNMSNARLSERIKKLFEEEKAGVTGRIGKDGVFTAFDKRVVVGWNMPGLRRKSVYLKGRIEPSDGGSFVRLKLSPNAILPLFGFSATLIGLLLLCLASFIGQSDNSFLLLGLLFLALAATYYSMSTLFRNRFRNKVVKYLGLKQV